MSDDGDLDQDTVGMGQRAGFRVSWRSSPQVLLMDWIWKVKESSYLEQWAQAPFIELGKTGAEEFLWWWEDFKRPVVKV